MKYSIVKGFAYVTSSIAHSLVDQSMVFTDL